MHTLESIKAGIQSLMKTNPHVHVNISIAHPKVNLTSQPATVKGTYKHVFRIDTHESTPRSFTFQYVDVLTKRIEIMELMEE